MKFNFFSIVLMIIPCIATVDSYEAWRIRKDPKDQRDLVSVMFMMKQSSLPSDLNHFSGWVCGDGFGGRDLTTAPWTVKA